MTAETHFQQGWCRSTPLYMCKLWTLSYICGQATVHVGVPIATTRPTLQGHIQDCT